MTRGNKESGERGEPKANKKGTSSKCNRCSWGERNPTVAHRAFIRSRGQHQGTRKGKAREKGGPGAPDECASVVRAKNNEFFDPINLGKEIMEGGKEKNTTKDISGVRPKSWKRGVRWTAARASGPIASTVGEMEKGNIR